MLFHPTFKAEKERKLVFQQGVSAVPGEGANAVPPVVELTEKQKEVQEQIKKIKEGNQDAAGELVNFKVNEAGETEAKLQARYREALTEAANTYYEYIAELPGDIDFLAKVNEAFTPAGVAFQIDVGTHKLVIGTEALGEEKGQPELSPKEEQRLQDALNSLPKDMQSMRKELEQFLREIFGDPETKKSGAIFSKALGNLSSEAQKYFTQNTERILSGELPWASPQLRNREGAFMSKIIFEKVAATPKIQQEIKEFWKSLGPDGQAFSKKLVARARSIFAEEKQALSETTKELSVEDRTEIEDGAREELKKFDASKASEVDKNLMLARLQMRGIDTSNAEEIFKDPSKLKAFEGSLMERGFNKIMGLIGYVLLSIEKMKGMVKPGEKRAEVQGPTNGTETPSPEKTALRQKLKEQMKKENGELLWGKERARSAAREEIKNLEKDLANIKGRDNKRGEITLENKIQQKKREEAQLSQEIMLLQEMKAEAEKQRDIHNLAKDASITYLNKPDVRAKITNGNVFFENLKKIRFDLNERYELCVRSETGEAVDQAVIRALFAAINFRFVTNIDYFASDDQGVLKNPENLPALFRQLLDSFRAEVKTDESSRLAAAPAPAVTPPAGTTPAAPAPAP